MKRAEATALAEAQTTGEASTVRAARLHGPRDLRLDTIAGPGRPGPGEVTIAVNAVGVCGSDIHIYQDGRIGDTAFPTPLTIGHEFAGTVLAVGEGSLDGNGEPLREGQRVAVDPQVSCGRCRQCREGHPNLCPEHAFYGVYPDDGALRERMNVVAANCFPLPEGLSDAAGALLETLGVAIHAVDLGHLRVGDTVAVLGCGPVGLLIARLAVLAGSRAVYAFDPLPWRAEKAREFGVTAAFAAEAEPPPDGVRDVDVVFEVAWADRSVQQAANLARPGGRVVLVGIPGDDGLSLRHSTARRKGLTLVMARRMKHTYPRAIALASGGQVDLEALVSHSFGLGGAPEALEAHASYRPGVQKAIVEPQRS